LRESSDVGAGEGREGRIELDAANLQERRLRGDQGGASLASPNVKEV